MDVRLLGPGDESLLSNAMPGAFDKAVDSEFAVEFLADPRHHISVALHEGWVVGFAAAVNDIHPDKPAELWVNKLAVAPVHHTTRIAGRLLDVILQAGREAGCREAWVLTDRDNAAAMRLYASAGGEDAPIDQVMFAFNLEP